MNIQLPQISNTMIHSLAESPANSPRMNMISPKGGNLNFAAEASKSKAANMKQHNFSMDIPNRYSISIQDVINSSRKNNDDFGLQGYAIPKFNAYMDKPVVFKMLNSKQKNFITDIQKQKGYIPGPQYETAGSTMLSKKMSFSKMPRITEITAVMKAAEKLPSPGQYETKIKQKCIGNFNLKSDRLGILDEAMFQGMQTPACYDSPRLEIYKPKTSVARILPCKKERFPKLEKNDSPSPMSYEMTKGYEKLKGGDHSFMIAKSKGGSFIDAMIKKKSLVPSVGTYDYTNSANFISKGKKSYR